MTMDDMREALDQMAEELPEEIFRELNGGVILLPDVRFHPKSRNNDFYILGEYHFEPRGFGRYITIYHGSFLQTHGLLPLEMQLKKLREVLHHELTHHLEHLAGDVSLEREDAIALARYLNPQSEI